MKKKKSLIIIAIIIAVFGICFLIPTVSKTLKEMTINNSTKYSGIEGYDDSYATSQIVDPDLGTWNISAAFSGNNVETYNEGSQLIYNSTNNTLDNNKVEVNYTITYQANSSSYDIDYGEMIFSIPWANGSFS